MADNLTELDITKCNTGDRFILFINPTDRQERQELEEHQEEECGREYIMVVIQPSTGYVELLYFIGKVWLQNSIIKQGEILEFTDQPRGGKVTSLGRVDKIGRTSV